MAVNGEAIELLFTGETATGKPALADGGEVIRSVGMVVSSAEANKSASSPSTARSRARKSAVGSSEGVLKSPKSDILCALRETGGPSWRQALEDI